MEAMLQNIENQEKLDYIFSELDKGVDREELAVRLGYKTYKSMDMFVRRQGYTWDRRVGRYLLPEERNSGRYSQAIPTTQGKVGEILTLFAKGDLDVREVAQKVGFTGHRELALYMKTKGYQWDANLGNYLIEEELVESEVQAGSKTTEVTQTSQITTHQIQAQDNYQELLAYLLQKEQLLRKILEQREAEESEGIIPRYAVPGIFVTKSVHMTNQLDQLIRDFSKEKNISQRELFEVALVEFFQKYGYKQAVDTLLQQR